MEAGEFPPPTTLAAHVLLTTYGAAYRGGWGVCVVAHCGHGAMHMPQREAEMLLFRHGIHTHTHTRARAHAHV